MKSKGTHAVIEHYVPQCYLRHFADKRQRLFVFDKTAGRSFCSHVRNVASERRFYDLPGNVLRPKADPKAVEHYLSRVEGELAEILRVLIEDLEQRRRIPIEAKQIIAPHIATMMLRTKEFRSEMHEVDQIVSDVERRTGSNRSCELREYLELAHAFFLLDDRFLAGITRVLVDHMWYVGEAPASTPLLTSDNPVTLHSNVGGPLGFAADGIEITFPISPRFVLVMGDKKYFASRVPSDRAMRELNDELVAAFNRRQVVHSSRRIMCNEDRFDEVVSFLAAHPECCDERRPRLVRQGH